MADSRTSEGGGTPAWELLLPSPDTAPAPASGEARSGQAQSARTAASAPRPRGRALRAALRDAIRSGRLAPGTPLPSSRELAADLGVSRGLVTDAYAQLTAEGYVNSRQGAGTWVSGLCTPPGIPDTRFDGADRRGGPCDFRPGLPDLSLFPRAAWSAAHRRVLTRLPHTAFGYPDPRGLPELRVALADLLARRRGVAVDPERVVVCSGVAQAHSLLGMVLASRGHRAVATEDPGSPEHTALFAAAGLTAVPVPLDGDGLDPGALAATGVRAAVITPSHQFPTGRAYSARRRGELVDWARAVDGLLIEDDYDGDFRYDREPVGALQGLAPDEVAYTGSVSKSLAPGLRLGWMVAPAALVGQVAERKRMMDLGNPVTEQATLAEFITGGHYDRQLRRCQRLYRARRNALTEALAGCFPGSRVSGIAAGLHAIVRLPREFGPEPRFLAAAARAGIAVLPLTHCTVGAEAPRDGGVRLVLGYAHLTPEAIGAAVRRLADAV